MTEPTLEVLGGSHKENERRLPIHPRQLAAIDEAMRGRISPSRGTAGRFGFADEDLAPLVGAVGSREQLIGNCDVLVIPKPTPADLLELPEGKVLLGWMHCAGRDDHSWPSTAGRR